MALTGTPSGEVEDDDRATPGVVVPPALAVRPRRPLLGSRRRQIVAGVLILGALSFLAYQGLNNATEYFLTTKQAVQQKATLGTTDFRIEGTVEHDVERVGTSIHFNIYNEGVTVAIVDSAQPGQLFKPGIPVVLEGHWQGSVYSADQIMVKHTANYVEAHPSRLKSQLPKSSSSASKKGSS